jgi:hypothetical protein
MHSVRSEALTRLGAALVDRGWLWWDGVDQETPSLTQNRSNNIVISVGFVSQNFPEGQVSFSPTLGVTHREVSRLAAAFNGRPWRGAGDSSSLGTSLSTLLQAAGISGAPYARWMISSPSEVERVGDVILGDLETYGTTFWDRFQDLYDMISWMQADKGYQALVGNLAIALAVTGANAEAADALEQYSAFTAQQSGRIRDRTNSFLSAFSTYFGFGAGAGMV